MGRWSLRFGARFDRILRQFADDGTLTVLRGQALADTIEALRANPLSYDHLVSARRRVHWIKECRGTDGAGVGLWVGYLLYEDGAVFLDDLYVIEVD